MVGFALAALAAGFSVVDKVPHVLVILAGILSVVWLLWLDHVEHVYKIAAFIGIRLSPLLGAHYGRDALGWESFRRRLDKGGVEAWEALGRPDMRGRAPSTVKILHSRATFGFVSYIFGLPTPVLLGVYAYLAFRDGWHARNGVPEVIGMTIVAALAAYAAFKHRLVVREVKLIDESISRAGGSG